MKNIHKRKNLMGIIYALIMLIPLLSVLVRTCYVTFNKNAKDSYSDSQIYQQYVISNTSQWITDVVINLTYKNPANTSSTNFYLNVNYVSYSAEDLNITPAQYDSITNIFFVRDGRIQFRDSSNQILSTLNWNTNTNFNIISTQETPSTHVFDIATVSRTILVQNKLDNAFEYSLKKITDNSNIGKLNLINWFVDVFLDSTNSTNALYLNFINWYLNYTLLVSCMYLLYLVLMWFINLARRILSKGFEGEI